MSYFSESMLLKRNMYFPMVFLLLKWYTERAKVWVISKIPSYRVW